VPVIGGVEAFNPRRMNCGYGADSGPSRGERRTRAIRPIEASKAAIRNGCFTSIPVVYCIDLEPGLSSVIPGMCPPMSSPSSGIAAVAMADEGSDGPTTGLSARPGRAREFWDDGFYRFRGGTR
jgi:hypothetical protein